MRQVTIGPGYTLPVILKNHRLKHGSRIIIGITPKSRLT
jgi:hypothetical protein